MKILVVGDLHGDWGKLNALIAKKTPDIILQCGDFGWWPTMEVQRPVLYGRQKTWLLKGIKPNGTKVYWCDGNHEQHIELFQDGEIHEMYENVYHCSRGSTLVLPDGRVVLFAGGAYSTDCKLRTPGHDWFFEENIDYVDHERLMRHNHIDIVISHTAPYGFDIFGNDGKVNDSNRVALKDVLNKYAPDLWYFGHWHKYKTGVHCNTNWTCLDYPGHGEQWWITLTI